MANTLILCGGTGAHVGVALLRLHTLGHAFGFFNQGDRPFDFPKLFLVDQDAGDRSEGEPTAWQLARRLVDLHPSRHDWQPHTGRSEAPELLQVTPLPIGPNQRWYTAPTSSLATRFEESPLLEAFAAKRQREIDYSKGMMGSPAIGSLLFKLKEYDERQRGLNQDETFGQMLKQDGRIVVAGSGVGGTGASVAPTLATSLAKAGRDRRQVMTVMVLNWFAFEEEGIEAALRVKAQLRNRIMNENANSALQYYGHALADLVAAVPVGMPERAMLTRYYTSDMLQPILESFIHAVAALCSLRHFLAPRPYGAGLYMMGAVDSAKLDGTTAIPKGTLQSLANQAATQLFTLKTWQGALSHGSTGRVVPAIHEAVRPHANPGQVAQCLGKEISHYEEQLKWMKETLAIDGAANRDFTRETRSRERLGQERHTLPIKSDSPPEQVASALFHWTAEWIREEASPHNGLVVSAAGEVRGGHWPELSGEGLAPAAQKAGELTRIKDADIDPTLQAFVNPDYLSCNGWPHPIAAADFFRHAIRREDPAAFRQLELLLVGLVSGVLELEEVPPLQPDVAVSLENLTLEVRRKHDYPGLAEVKVVYPRQKGMVVGFNSPHTVLCPVPFMDDEASNQLWNELWTTLSGATDGAPWNEAAEPENWHDYDLVVRQIKMWIDHQKKAHRGNSPPWTKVFARYPGGETRVPFGAGRLLKVLWGAPSAEDRPLVDLNLPTKDTGPWTPPPGTPMMKEAELLELVPELEKLEDEKGEILFEMVEFEVPGEADKVRGWWDEHLDALAKAGKIFLWSPGTGDGIFIGLSRNGVLQACLLVGSRLLARSTVTVPVCTPLRQDPVPGSSTPEGEIRYPDLPIKSDFLDLVETPEGVPLLDTLKSGKDISSTNFRPSIRRDAQSRQVIKWSLRLRGRTKPLPIEICLEAGTEPHRAHWMVWPRFRTRSGAGWKTYYVYERCSFTALRADTLWLDAGPTPETTRMRRRLAEAEALSYPINYDTKSDPPGHSGGPPLALSLRDTRRDEEQGLYLVPLKVLSSSPVELAIGVDFGTSHCVAAVRVGGGEPETVELLPELAPTNASKALSVHLSEDQSHVQAPLEGAGILATGTWLPTYTSNPGNGFLPSELLLIPSLEKVQPDTVGQWLPGTTFTIPRMDIGRTDLAEHVLADFKWETSTINYRGRETDLREHYLSMFLDLVMADVVTNHAGGFPELPVKLTFTYPLRSTEKQVAELTESLEWVIKRCANGLGIPMALKDDFGIYDESRAARLSIENFGEVVLVADLGGGTLDLFIASQGKPGITLAEVADSARLGGNLLLGQIARSPAGYLPSDGGWFDNGGPQNIETKLRAWMRSEGASRLFGLDARGRPEFREMNLKGFDQPAKAALARILLDRYFRLIVEYLARNLVAYLAGHWYPSVPTDEHQRLQISVQLRGNGWRLRFQEETYTAATDAIRDEVRLRAEALWQKVKDNPYRFPKDDRHWASAARYAVDDPKAAPIKSVVGKAMPFSEIKGNWYSHTLIDLEVIHKNGTRSEVEWYRKVPFETRASQHVEIHELSPPLVVSSPFDDERVEIKDLEAELHRWVAETVKVEGVLDPTTGTYRAPIAPIVWEAAFKSRGFQPTRKG